MASRPIEWQSARVRQHLSDGSPRRVKGISELARRYIRRRALVDRSASAAEAPVAADPGQALGERWAASIIESSPGYARFPLAVPVAGRIRCCVVEILSKGAATADGGRLGPTVVLHEISPHPGLVNWVEIAVELVAANHLGSVCVSPSEVIWILHLQKWELRNDDPESTWSQLGVCLSEQLKPTEPRCWTGDQVDVEFGEDVAGPLREVGPATARDRMFSPVRYRQLASKERVELRFTDDTCHKERTGVCSVLVTERVDDDDGQAGWDYCRRLADLAALWHAIEKDAPGWCDTEMPLAEVQSRLSRDWAGPCGMSTSTAREALGDARSAFSRGAMHASQLPGGTVTFGDGQHRHCAANKVGVSLPLEIAELPVPRLRSKES